MGRILWGRGAGRDLADEPGTGLRDYMQTLGAIKATLPFVDPLFKRIWTEAHRPDATPRKKAAAQKLIDGLTPEQKARLDQLRAAQAARQAPQLVPGLVPAGLDTKIRPPLGGVPPVKGGVLTRPPSLLPQPGMGSIVTRQLTPGRQSMLSPQPLVPTGPTPPVTTRVPERLPLYLDPDPPAPEPAPAPPIQEREFDVEVPVVGGSIDVGEFARRLRQKNLAGRRERAGRLPEDLSQFSLAQLRAIRKLAKTPEDIARLGEAARARGRFELAPGLMDALGGRTGAGKGERYVLDELPKQMTALEMQMLMAKIADLRSKGRNREAQALERMARSGLLQAKTGLTRAKLAKLLAKMRGRKGGPGVLAWMRKNPDMLRATQVETAAGKVTVWVPKKGLPRADLLSAQRMAARANRLANPRLSRKQIIQAARDLKKHKALTEHRKKSRDLKKAQVDALRLFGDLVKPSEEE
jgi:hypothetical protein